jgi:hypothetical protein
MRIQTYYHILAGVSIGECGARTGSYGVSCMKPVPESIKSPLIVALKV